jgi:hypothetical protein
VGSIVAAYNRYTREFLVLSQALMPSPGVFGAIQGQRFDSHLRPIGSAVEITPHDYYLRDLAVNPDNGEYLLVQIGFQGGFQAPPSPGEIFAIRLGADGNATAVSAWNVASSAERFAFGRVRAAYDSATHGYRVAWLLTGSTDSVIASRAVSANGELVSAPVAAIQPGPLDNPQFTFAAGPNGRQFVIAWVSPTTTSKLELRAQPLDLTGAPISGPETISDIVDPPAIREHRPQLTTATGRFVVSWQNTGSLRIAAIPIATGPATPSVQIALPNDPTGSTTSAADPTARTVLILWLTNNPGGPNQIHARLVPLSR